MRNTKASDSRYKRYLQKKLWIRHWYRSYIFRKNTNPKINKWELQIQISIFSYPWPGWAWILSRKGIHIWSSRKLSRPFSIKVHLVLLMSAFFTSYGPMFYVNIITGSIVMLIFLYKGLTESLEIGNIPVWVLFYIWRLGRVRDTKFGMNVSDEILLNFVKFQGCSFFTISELLRENQQGGGGRITPHTHTHTHTRTHARRQARTHARTHTHSLTHSLTHSD